MNGNESEAIKLWRRTVDALIAKGESPADAIDGANLVLLAYQRQHGAEDPEPVSGTRSGIRRKKQETQSG